MPSEGFRKTDVEKFRTAGTRCQKFYDENRKKMQNYQLLGGLKPTTIAHWLCEAVEKSMDGQEEKVTPGYYSSDYTFAIRLPRFLSSEGILE